METTEQTGPRALLLECPACGGAGGGPFGRLGGAWDTEDYVCPRCEGSGVVAPPGLAAAPASYEEEPAQTAPRVAWGTPPDPRSARPSIAKTSPASVQEKKKRAQ